MLRIVFSLLLLIPSGVNAHGFFSSPTARSSNNSPVGNQGDRWVCQVANSGQAPVATLTAGGTLDVQWTFTASHIGDCSMYLSYDSGATVARADMKWFKIANFPDCDLDKNAPVTMNVPEWLPAGQAVMRWDWYALHVFSGVEFYTQCVDVTVVAGNNPKALSAIPTYAMAGQYPNSPATGGTYWNPYTNPEPWQQEGPDCAPDITGNCCEPDLYKAARQPNGPGMGFNFCKDLGTSPNSGNYDPQPSSSPGLAAASVEHDCEVYVVQEGDTATSIGDIYGVSAVEICSDNNIDNCNNIYPGEQLIIPGTCGNNQPGTASSTAPIFAVVTAMFSFLFGYLF